MATRATHPDRPPHVIVIGAGFGGLATIRGLCNTAVRVTWIDRKNYHLFQPLLYQVATAALSPADIAAPARGIARTWRNV
jgi:NADH dehydrogenase